MEQMDLMKTDPVGLEDVLTIINTEDITLVKGDWQKVYKSSHRPELDLIKTMSFLAELSRKYPKRELDWVIPNVLYRTKAGNYTLCYRRYAVIKHSWVLVDRDGTRTELTSTNDIIKHGGSHANVGRYGASFSLSRLTKLANVKNTDLSLEYIEKMLGK